MNEQNKTTVAEMWQEGARANEDLVRQFHVNEAYAEGYHWWEWSNENQEITPPLLDEDSDRIQATMNHFRANTRTIISMLTQRELSFWVPPTGYDDATKRGARLAMALLEEKRIQSGWEDLREEHMRATWTGGTAAIAVEWSEANNETVETVLPPSDFVVEPGARRLEYARWWIKQQLIPPREAQATFPDHFKDGPPKADGHKGRNHSSAYGLEAEEDRVPLTRVLTYYERPNPLNPKGKVVVEIDDKTVAHGDWPFPWNHRLNIAVARETVRAGSGWGSTIASDVQSPQIAMNAAWSGFLEALRDASTNKLIMDETWEDNLDELSDRPGDVLVGRTRDGIQKPSWLSAPPVPQTVVEGINMLTGVIDDLTGVHDVSRGQAPANIESGYGLSILAEKDSSPVGRMIKQSAHVWGWVASMNLMLYEANMKGKHESTVRMPNGPMLKKWSGKDLRGQTNAIVPLDAIVPRSQAAMQQFAQTAATMSLLGDPADPMTAVRMIQLADMPDQRGLISTVNPDADKAIRENEQMANGEPALPDPIDDHAIHIEILHNFMKTEEFELLSEEEQGYFRAHGAAHETMSQQEMASRAQGAAIDPALASSPRADGAPPVDVPPDVLPPEAPPAEPLPGDLPPEAEAEEMTEEELVASTLDAMDEEI